MNPTNTFNIVGQWHQDRWSNGGARGIGGAYSNTGGAGWTDVTVPYTSCAPSGLPYELGSDPWVSFGPDGTAYSSALSFDGPFDLMSAPVARGLFLGDYEGLQSTGAKSFIAMFVTTNCNLNPSDPNTPPTGNPLCGPASSTATATPNTAAP